MATTKITIDAIAYNIEFVGIGINGNVYKVLRGKVELGRVAEGHGDGWFVVLAGNNRPTASGMLELEDAASVLVGLYLEAQRAEIEAQAAEAEVAEQVEAEQVETEQAIPAVLPLHVNVEIDKRMRPNPAALFNMQALAEWARVMPINAKIQAGGEIYYLWGASEFPAFMGADGTAEIWAFPDARPCRWLSISLGSAPRTAYVRENWDEVEQRADFYRDDDALPF